MTRRMLYGIGAALAFWLFVASLFSTRGMILAVLLLVGVTAFFFWLGWAFGGRE